MQVNELGGLLRQARKRARMTQAHLAQAAEVSEKTVRRAEAGMPISAETYRALCSVIGTEHLSHGADAGHSCGTPERRVSSAPGSWWGMRGCRACHELFFRSGPNNYICKKCRSPEDQDVNEAGVPKADNGGIGSSKIGTNAATSRSRIREATPEFSRELAGYEGNILTARGGIAEVSESQRRFVAMLDNRLLVVSRSHALHHDVAAARSFLRRKGIVWSLEYRVDAPIIRAIYENAGKGRNGATPLGDGLATAE